MAFNEQGYVAKEEKGQEVRPLLRDGSVLYGYREVPRSDSSKMDVLEQLKSNIRQIEDLNGKLAFLLQEVQSVLKKA
jgi:hypothetical protein